MDDHHQAFVIYSPNESACNIGAGFWSNDRGWSLFENATRFSASQQASVPLLAATGHDARYVTWREANAHYG